MPNCYGHLIRRARLCTAAYPGLSGRTKSPLAARGLHLWACGGLSSRSLFDQLAGGPECGIVIRNGSEEGLITEARPNHDPDASASHCRQGERNKSPRKIRNERRRLKVRLACNPVEGSAIYMKRLMKVRRFYLTELMTVVKDHLASLRHCHPNTGPPRPNQTQKEWKIKRRPVSHEGR